MGQAQHVCWHFACFGFAEDVTVTYQDQSAVAVPLFPPTLSFLLTSGSWQMSDLVRKSMGDLKLSGPTAHIFLCCPDRPRFPLLRGRAALAMIGNSMIAAFSTERFAAEVSLLSVLKAAEVNRDLNAIGHGKCAEMKAHEDTWKGERHSGTWRDYCCIWGRHRRSSTF